MVDKERRNALHCLIYVSFMKDDCEEDMIQMFRVIKNNVPKDVMRGRRLLEYALHLEGGSLVSEKCT